MNVKHRKGEKKIWTVQAFCRKIAVNVMRTCCNGIELHIFVTRNKFETDEERIWKVADGSLQVYGNGHAAYNSIRRHGYLVVGKPRYYYFSISIVHRPLAVARQKTEKQWQQSQYALKWRS